MRTASIFRGRSPSPAPESIQSTRAGASPRSCSPINPSAASADVTAAMTAEISALAALVTVDAIGDVRMDS
jgi:hypothetical protein